MAPEKYPLLVSRNLFSVVSSYTATASALLLSTAFVSCARSVDELSLALSFGIL